MINDNVPLPFLYIFFILFPVMWVAVMILLRKQSRMVKSLDFDPGEKIKSSGWGSAVINGVQAKNCVCIDVYSQGYVVRMMSLFGGARIWIEKASLTVIDEQSGTFFLPGYIEIKSKEEQIRLYGKLGRFISV